VKKLYIYKLLLYGDKYRMDANMKVSQVIKRLQKLKDEFGDLAVVIDMDENGWYNAEKVELAVPEEDDTLFINIKSSNEC